MSARADEIVSTLVDDGLEGEIDPELRKEVARRLVIHGLLLQSFRKDTLDAQVARAIRSTGRLRRWGGSAAAAGILAGVIALFFAAEPLPTAEAAVERAMKTLEESADLQYRVRLYLDEADEPTHISHWSVRADRWTLRVDRPLGVHWLGGTAQNGWWISPSGQLTEWSRKSSMPVMKEFDPSLFIANPYQALKRMRSEFRLTMKGRETLDGTRVLHIHGLGTAEGVSAIDVWVHEETGRVFRADLRVDRGGRPHRRHVLEYAGSDPRPDDYYLPAGHPQKHD